MSSTEHRRRAWSFQMMQESRFRVHPKCEEGGAVRCTCKLWFTEEPEWDPSCEYEKHAELAFLQRGWDMLHDPVPVLPLQYGQTTEH